MNEDPTDAKGMATLVNKRKVDQKLDLDAIERDLIVYSGKTTKIHDTTKEYNDIMRDVRSTSYDAPRTPVVSRSPIYVHENPNRPTFGGLNTMQAFNGQYPSVVGDDDPESDDDDDIQDSSNHESDDDDIQDSPNYNINAPPINVTNSPRVPMPRSTVPFSSHTYRPPPSYPPHYAPQSYPQHAPQAPQGYQPGYAPQGYAQQQPYTNMALQAFSGQEDYQESLLEQERMEERKEKMLADIDDLREELAQDDIDTSRIPEVNGDTPFEDVSKIYKILKRKYDRSRCEDLGKGVVMAGARMLEMVFDGKKGYFGYRPDMTGWHRTVRSKMRRMRYEQSVIVSDAIERYNIGPMQRMALELFPSAFLYSLTRREQHGAESYNPSTPGTEDRSTALDDLRDFAS